MPLSTTLPRNRRVRAPLFPDLPLLAITLGLVIFGIVMLYSTTATVAEARLGDSLFYVRRQIAAGVVGFAALILLARTPLAVIEKWVPVLFGISPRAWRCSGRSTTLA